MLVIPSISQDSRLKTKAIIEMTPMQLVFLHILEAGSAQSIIEFKLIKAVVMNRGSIVATKSKAEVETIIIQE